MYTHDHIECCCEKLYCTEPFKPTIGYMASIVPLWSVAP